MNSSSRRNLVFFSTLAVILALAVISPRARIFLRLAALEFRILWWLLIIAAAGFYLAFFVGRKRD